ncbi:uncharacterized protein LOC135698865 [Ochlerotatus camptorhynchus]|uniref:uncharacterized protein LOC135698865 n=1 Tax=Ochlerotatus camptorhynchus TaxID=644619 RepID=UPI0031D1C653
MRFLVLPQGDCDAPYNLNQHGREVDIVLGIEAFFEFFESGRKITIGKHLPSLSDSVFGWVVCGGCSTPINSLQLNCHFSTSKDLEKLMARFWSCEEVEFTDAYSLEEKKCEELFQRGVQRGPEGRYTIPLPKNKDVLPNLDESRDIEFQRLLGRERRLARDANLREQYIGFMDEYLKLGHMRKVEETTEGPVKRCYLPHHPVVKEASTTTKVRVVFDASCKTSSGVSLNDVLLVGPVVQEDFRAIILRSRMKQILLVSDVEKMFRQILTWLKDRPLQSVLFRFSPDEEVAVYELNTVTFRLLCSDVTLSVCSSIENLVTECEFEHGPVGKLAGKIADNVSAASFGGDLVADVAVNQRVHGLQKCSSAGLSRVSEIVSKLKDASLDR